MKEQSLNLRDIHLPEPVSWWPVAPGWWFLIAGLMLVLVILFIARRIYASRQLYRDIAAELERIKQQFHQYKNEAQLAKSLSILLRRASISFYSQQDRENRIAGLTGEKWLAWLDKTHRKSGTGASAMPFQSDIGRALITAPYLPDNAPLDFDANQLIQLCESWLQQSHGKKEQVT